VDEALKMDIVQEQLKLLRCRNAFPAFGFEAKLTLTQEDESTLQFVWEKDGFTATLRADFAQAVFSIAGVDPQGTTVFSMAKV
jgi:sucrose phosphorylase